MSRSQQGQIINTAEANSGADQTNATKAVNVEAGHFGNYETQLAKFSAENPYKEGGEFDTATDQKLSGVADVGSKAIADQLQTQAKRTGQNAGAATATAAEVARQNERDLATGEAGATQARIGDEAGYNQTVLGASEVPAQLEAGIYGTSLGAANGALNTAGSSAQTPGFWDTLGDSFAQSLGKTAGKVGG